ncbi:hypothetical protein [Streptomyces pseudovenezuelae]|uniref:hypothetical protein n=1 Tax=Streptomyces pseudovenezuelae TaxID=67350 RepID=UPI002E8198A6|nr:hypothetical protein [Streptomyces pseudovenezuelae]WUA94486.1 hypothetical protein OHO81_44740 [Streptomyces pseudovenezuelae]
MPASTNDTASKATANALAAELHRRALRMTELAATLDVPVTTVSEVRGEVIGLRAAIGIVLGGSVTAGTADELGHDYYRDWLRGQAGAEPHGAGG